MKRKGKKFQYGPSECDRSTKLRRTARSKAVDAEWAVFYLQQKRQTKDAQIHSTATVDNHGPVSYQPQVENPQMHFISTGDYAGPTSHQARHEVEDAVPNVMNQSDTDCTSSFATDEMGSPACDTQDCEMESAHVDRADRNVQFQKSGSIFSVAKQPRNTLCPCTQLTSDDIVLMVLAIGMRHQLTWVAQLDILKMIDAIFPKRHIPLSKHLLFKRVRTKTVNVKYHVFCPHCDKYLSPSTSLVKSVNCPICNRNLQVEQAANYFCSISISDQLRDLFQGSEDMGRHMLEFRANRKSPKPNHLEDIFDGEEYQLHCQPGAILSNPNNFSYNFFTDGVPVGHSGKSLWPLFLTINELPEKLRTKYVLLAGLYIGPKEPTLRVFLEPFVQEANRLSSDGFTWSLDGVDICSKALPMCAIADSPARAKLLNRQNHSAYWGCTFCYHKKERTPTSSRPQFLIKTGVAERDSISTAEDIDLAWPLRDKARKEDRQHRGVYGPSSIQKLNNFDVCTRVPVDYMHCLLLGAARAHMHCLFDSDSKDKYWNLDAGPTTLKVEDIMVSIDERLKDIKPPKSITRSPRSLKDRGSWKASEWRSWLLFYCVVCLRGILKDEYLVHLAKLSAAAYMLLQDSVSVAQVKQAHFLLCSYQCDYQKYFGCDTMTYNIHLLKHIAPGVLKFGPLWTHSSFPYEGNNRYMLQLLTSPFNVVKQITNRYLINLAYPDTCASLSSNDSVIEFCEDILERKLKVYVYSSGCYLLGKGQQGRFTDEEIVSLKQHNCEDGYWQKSLAYKRMLHKGFRVYALGCTEVSDSKNANNYVFVDGVGISVVENIILTPKPDAKVVILVRSVILDREAIVTDEQDFQLEHIQRLRTFGALTCIYPGEITGQCVFMDAGEAGRYVSKLPYGCYRD